MKNGTNNFVQAWCIFARLTGSAVPTVLGNSISAVTPRNRNKSCFLVSGFVEDTNNIVFHICLED